MSASVLFMSMSLDGYIAGPNNRPGNPSGDGFGRPHDWLASADGFDRPSGPAGELYDEMVATGALLVGRRTAEQVDRYRGHHHGVPIVVVSHQPAPASVADYPLVTEATNGIVDAMAQAKAAAGGQNVLLHGAQTAQRALEAGVLDELQLHQNPGAVRPGAPAVRRLAVAHRVGDRKGHRHAGGHTHSLPRSTLSRMEHLWSRAPNNRPNEPLGKRRQPTATA